MKKIFKTLMCAVVAVSMLVQPVLANKTATITEEENLELLALSEIVYEIPSETFISNSVEGNYNIIAGNSIRKIEVDGNKRKAVVTIKPNDMFVYGRDQFLDHPITFNIGLYDANGKKLLDKDNVNKICRDKITYTCRSSRSMQDYANHPVLSDIQQSIEQYSVVAYKEFKISLPTAQEKQVYYLVIEPSSTKFPSNVITANIETQNSKVVAPDEKFVMVYKDYFGAMKNNIKVTSNEFLEKIHPGMIYVLNGATIWWKNLVKDVLADYTYVENNEETDIKGSGFFAATFINEKKKKLVIAYRGTEPDTPEDISTDIELVFKVKPDQVVYADKYYKYIINKYKGYDVILTGHSLGGGLACGVTFENLGNKQITYMPGWVEYASYPDSPVSVSFNGAVGLVLNLFSDEIKKEMIYADANYVNYVSSRPGWFNDKTVGLGADHNQWKRKYVQDCINATDVKGGNNAVHMLSGFVLYENGQYKITPLEDYYFETE